jgi:NAD(P)-dependent dehydrogenase (short-subunit alcohol dehydrogenase family)
METRAEIAVITEASWGIGAALAAALVRRGVAVAGLSQEAFALEGVLSVQADIRNPAEVAHAFDVIREKLGAPTILINNAETYPDRDILDETPETFLDTVQLNLGGAFNCCHAALPAMVDSGRGRIINVVTFADISPAPLAAAYSVSKGALRILTRAMVADLGDRFGGIVINDWVPGTHQPRKGIPDGVDPGLAAEWGAKLALMNSPDLNGLVFLRDREHVPPRSLKGRVKDRVLGKGRARVRLG